MFSHRLISDNPVFRQFAESRGLEVGTCTPVQFMEAVILAIAENEAALSSQGLAIEELTLPATSLSTPAVPSQVSLHGKRGRQRGASG